MPKLDRTELEAACEDFSNIIVSYPLCTIYKGTLSSGVEIAVVSTAVASNNWSKRSEAHFRKKVCDMLVTYPYCVYLKHSPVNQLPWYFELLIAFSLLFACVGGYSVTDKS